MEATISFCNFQKKTADENKTNDKTLYSVSINTEFQRRNIVPLSNILFFNEVIRNSVIILHARLFSRTQCVLIESPVIPFPKTVGGVSPKCSNVNSTTVLNTNI